MVIFHGYVTNNQRAKSTGYGSSPQHMAYGGSWNSQFPKPTSSGASDTGNGSPRARPEGEGTDLEANAKSFDPKWK